MRTGTSHFISFEAACRYYRLYESELLSQAALDRFVAQKIVDGEIHIGEPPIKAGEYRQLIDDKTRYEIVTP